MLDLLSTLIWALALMFTANRLALAWETVARPAAQPMLVRPDLAEEIPQDLVALAMSEGEAWAQEELLRVIRERYEDLKDWNLVRTAMGIGRIE